MSRRRVPLDENLPVRLRQWLPDVEATTVELMGWKGAWNGELVRLARAKSFVIIDQMQAQGCGRMTGCQPHSSFWRRLSRYGRRAARPNGQVAMSRALSFRALREQFPDENACRALFEQLI
jgi:hypothetical protein